MENNFTGKIVTKSKPCFTKEGNRWASQAVYYRNGNFYMREVITPTDSYGPFELGEEIALEAKPSDIPAEEWMIEIYKSPSSYTDVMNRKKDREYEEEYEEEHKGNKVTNLIISLLVIAIVGILLKTLIFG